MPWPIVGHEWAVTLLRRSLAAGRLSHAYLISGPPQVGKTTLAMTLAQALNCREPDAPCGRCASCQRIASGSHPDVQVVAGKGTGGAIQIDQIRTLQREAALAPYSGRFRVYILRQMDRATPEAANCLLKTLEEPPPHVVLVLTAIHRQGQPRKAGHREGLPPTIVSRCQCLDLRPITRSSIEATLRARGLNAAQADLLARLSGGRVGWAITAARDESLLRQRRQDLDQLLALLPLTRVGRLDLAQKMGRDPVAARRQIEVWTVWWRDLLLTCAGNAQYTLNADEMATLQAYARRCSVSEVQSVLEALRDAAEQLEENVHPRLAMEGLLLRLPRLSPEGAV